MTVSVDAVVYYKIINPIIAITNISDYRYIVGDNNNSVPKMYMEIFIDNPRTK